VHLGFAFQDFVPSSQFELTPITQAMVKIKRSAHGCRPRASESILP
jgi:hypothetical protein